MTVAPPSSNAMKLPPSPAAAETPAASGQGIPPGSVSSSDILRGKKAVEIRHNGATYRLQATRLGKLILTK